MEREVYEKPKMEFEEVTTSSAIANTCWGYHGSKTKLYADIDGAGWLSFQIGEGSCALNLIEVTYYEDQNSTGTTATPDQINVLKEIIKTTSEGKEGNSYKGEGKTVIPENPDTNWS